MDKEKGLNKQETIERKKQRQRKKKEQSFTSLKDAGVFIKKNGIEFRDNGEKFQETIKKTGEEATTELTENKDEGTAEEIKGVKDIGDDINERVQKAEDNAEKSLEKIAEELVKNSLGKDVFERKEKENPKQENSYKPPFDIGEQIKSDLDRQQTNKKLRPKEPLAKNDTKTNDPENNKQENKERWKIVNEKRALEEYKNLTNKINELLHKLPEDEVGIIREQLNNIIKESDTLEGIKKANKELEVFAEELKNKVNEMNLTDSGKENKESQPLTEEKVDKPLEEKTNNDETQLEKEKQSETEVPKNDGEQSKPEAAEGKDTIKDVKNLGDATEGMVKNNGEEQPGTEVPKDDGEQPGGGELPTTETYKISADVAQQMDEKFKISKEDLGQIEGFQNLTEGQQLLVLENLKQLTLGRIQDEAGAKYKQNTSDAKFLSRIWQGISKKYQIAKLEKAKAGEIEGGGIETHQETLQQLVNGMKEFGPEVKVENGKIEIQYASGFDNLTPEQTEQVNNFNKIATEFSKMPAEWNYATASKAEQKQYKEIKGKYELAKRDILNIKETEVGGRDACLYINDIDGKVQLNQFLNAHPEVEDTLKNIKDEKVWFRALSNVITERGLYMGAGFVVRYATVSMIGLVGAPIAAAGMGGFFAYRRGKESLQENDKKARKGEISKEKIVTKKGKEIERKKRDFVDVKILNKRIDQLSNKITQENDEKKQATNIKHLDRLLKYTQSKIEDGLVNFGQANERLVNQYTLISNLSRAQANNSKHSSENSSEIDERLERILQLRKEKISKKQRKYLLKQIGCGATISAGFATAGYGIRYLGGEFGWWKSGIKGDMPPESMTKELYDNLGNLSPEDKDYIAKHGVMEYISQREFNDALSNLETEEKIAGVLGGDNEANENLINLKETPIKPEEITEVKKLLEDIGIPKENIEKTVNGLGAGGLLKDKIIVLQKIQEGNSALVGAGIPDEVRKKITLESFTALAAGGELPSSENFVEQGVKMTEENFKEAHQLLEKTGADIEFKNGKLEVIYEVGKGKEFKYMDRALRRIVMDKMEISGNKFTAIEAAKVENALANLRELTLGRDVADMKAENFKDIISFDEKTGRLEIKDYSALEEKLDSLTGHAGNIIDEQSDALAYVNDTSQENWQKMLDDKTGIADNDVDGGIDVDAENRITAEDFNEDENVLAAEDRVRSEEAIKTKNVEKINNIKQELEKATLLDNTVTEIQNASADPDKVIGLVADGTIERTTLTRHPRLTALFTNNEINYNENNAIMGINDIIKTIGNTNIGLSNDNQVYYAKILAGDERKFNIEQLLEKEIDEKIYIESQEKIHFKINDKDAFINTEKGEIKIKNGPSKRITEGGLKEIKKYLGINTNNSNNISDIDVPR